MRYATFSLSYDRTQRIGVIRGDRLLDVRKLVGNRLGTRWGGFFPSSMQDFIEAGPGAWRRMALLIEEHTEGEIPADACAPPEQVRLHAPIPRPAKNVFCLGLNYASHMQETARVRGREIKIPEVPVFFTKAPTSVTGPNDQIFWDQSVTSEVDWEVELGVIIGVGGRDIPREKALQHVFGYTIINDLSARDLQQKHLQWFKGKSLDGFCPMGPHVVTADEFGDPQNKKLSLRVNGVTKQSATTAAMIFGIPVIIESLSRGMTLNAGDVIATGTPEGVGLGRNPPEYLKDGDLVEAEVEGIGILHNRLVAGHVPAPA